MQNEEQLSLGQIQAFLEATEEVRFEGSNQGEVYAWISRTLCEQEYWKQARGAKGLLRRYLQRMTGLSRAQVTRLIAGYLATGTVKERRYRRNRFANRYTASDVALLAEVDEAHETLSGPATRKILQRELTHYGDQGYERLAGISAAHIYNLRKSRAYREKRLRYEDPPGADCDWGTPALSPVRDAPGAFTGAAGVGGVSISSLKPQTKTPKAGPMLAVIPMPPVPCRKLSSRSSPV